MSISDLAIINGDYVERKMKESKKETSIISRIAENIPDDLKIKVSEIASNRRIADANEKADMIADVMEKYGFVEIGTGTNRIAFLKDGYVYKVALDMRGFIDNISEYKRSIEFPKYFFKVYEVLSVTKKYKHQGTTYTTTTTPIMICEYCELINESTFVERKAEIKSILEYLSQYYIMDDVGLTNKNYCNWGLRHIIDSNGERDELVILDNAYFYPIRNNYNILRCSCGAPIKLNSNFTGYLCSNHSCGMTYTVAEILNKSGYDYDSGDTELVSVINDNGDKTDEYLQVTGNDTGNLEDVILNKNEAQELIEKYQNASDVSTEPNSISVDEYFSNCDDEPDDSEVSYKPLNVNDIKTTKNGGKE